MTTAAVILAVILSYIDVSIDPSSFDVSLREGAILDTTLIVTNNGDSTVYYTISEEPPAGWLSEWPTSGNLLPGVPQTVNVGFDSRDTVNYPPGNYSSVLMFTFAVFSETSYAFVPVFFTITPTPRPSIWVSPAYFDVSIHEKDSTERHLIIGNAGDTTLIWNIAEDPEVGWLSQEPPAGTAEPDSFSEVTVHFYSSIPPGSYQTTLLILSNDPSNDTVPVPVYFEVINIPEPDISVSPESVAVSLVQGETAEENLLIENMGDAPLTWSITDSLAVSWLAIDPTSGTVPESTSFSVSLWFEADGMEPRIYSTILCVSSNDPYEPEVYVPVELNVIQGVGDLAGIVHNLRIEETYGTLDSSDYVGSAHVELIDSSGNVFGPVITDMWGNYALLRIPVEDYTMHIYKIIELPPDLPLGKDVDTINVLIPDISVYPGDNHRDVLLPVMLSEQNYYVLADLSTLKFSVPEWNVEKPLTKPYDVRPAQFLIDSWTAGIDTTIIDGLGRLWMSEFLLREVFEGLSAHGTEGAIGFAEMLTLLLSAAHASNNILCEIPGSTEKELVEHSTHILSSHNEEVLNRIVATQSDSLSGLLKDTYCKMLLVALNNQSNWNHFEASRQASIDEFNDGLFSEYYVEKKTQPLLALSVQYADSGDYSGNLSMAYARMSYAERTIGQRLESKSDLARNLRELLGIVSQSSKIEDRVSSLTGFEKLVGIGGILDSLEFVSYVEALSPLLDEFDMVPDTLRQVMTRVYYPDGDLLGENLGSELGPRPASQSPRPISSDRLPLEEYTIVLENIKTALANRDRNRLREMFPELMSTDKGFGRTLHELLSQIYSVSSAARDSVDNFISLYRELGESLESSCEARFLNLAYLLCYYECSSIEDRDRAYFYIDTLKEMNRELDDKIGFLIERLSPLTFPAIAVFSHIEIESVQDILQVGDTIRIKATVCNPGGFDAQNVRVLCESSTGIQVFDSLKVLGTLPAGEIQAIEFFASVTSASKRLEGVYFQTTSSNAFTLSRFLLIPGIAEVTPSTGSRLSSRNVYAYKNPFNPMEEGTIIRFSLSRPGRVSIEIFDTGNNLVTALLNACPMKANLEQSARWSGRTEAGEVVANGVYFAVISTDTGEKAVCKIAVVR